MSSNAAGMKKKPSTKKPSKIDWDDVRRIALSLPGTEERPSYGTPGFRVAGKLFARFHQDGESLVLYIEYSAREVLTGANPRAFYITDHYRCYPMMLVRIAAVSHAELSKLIAASWRLRAPKKLIDSLDHPT